jgi:hypothetical protein
MINKPKHLVEIALKYLSNDKGLSKLKKKKSLWPLAFVQFCIKKVDEETDREELMSNIADDEGFGGNYTPSFGHSSIFDFHDYQEIWDNIEKKFKLKKAVPGSLVIWKNESGGGHIAIVEKAIDSHRIAVIEGSDSKVIKKTRSLTKEKDMALIGIITPWH